MFRELPESTRAQREGADPANPVRSSMVTLRGGVLVRDQRERVDPTRPIFEDRGVTAGDERESAATDSQHSVTATGPAAQTAGQ